MCIRDRAERADVWQRAADRYTAAAEQPADKRQLLRHSFAQCRDCLPKSFFLRREIRVITLYHVGSCLHQIRQLISREIPDRFVGQTDHIQSRPPADEILIDIIVEVGPYKVFQQCQRDGLYRLIFFGLRQIFEDVYKRQGPSRAPSGQPAVL